MCDLDLGKSFFFLIFKLPWESKLSIIANVLRIVICTVIYNCKNYKLNAFKQMIYSIQWFLNASFKHMCMCMPAYGMPRFSLESFQSITRNLPKTRQGNLISSKNKQTKKLCIKKIKFIFFIFSHCDIICMIIKHNFTTTFSWL